jgi:hypothetical protein
LSAIYRSVVESYLRTRVLAPQWVHILCESTWILPSPMATIELCLILAPEAILLVGDSNESANEAGDAIPERDLVVEATQR